jgi:radical SAM family uncharacterized protein/radical SAM-linked protein
LDRKLERLLAGVRKPARYAGGEYNQVIKTLDGTKLRVALCFPDIYEIGMSNLGFNILYGLANAMDGVWCERAFAPWGDMEAAMRASGAKLYGLESGDELRDFDIVAFSVGYEMAYTSVLNMLDLAGLPVRASDRDGSAPLVIAGGTCCYNPEPLADFIDLFIIGEGEEVNGEVYEEYIRCKEAGAGRAEFLLKASRIKGVYVPSLYSVTYGADGTISSISSAESAPLPVTKRIAADFDAAYFPERPIVPSTEIVHDRSSVELFRGCIRGCRFCQAGYVYRPVRQRRAETAARAGIAALSGSGYSEISLASLSTSDYRGISQLTQTLNNWCEPRKISLSLPSLRADNFSIELMGSIQKVRRGGLTFAPEAGSQRLRDVINKNVTHDDIINTCRTAFSGGWSAVKLYFMLGLPTETDEDVLAIADMAAQIMRAWRESASNKNRGVRITVSTSFFVPKPHTPFQWEPQISPEEYTRRVELLRGAMRTRSVVYNWHSPETGYIEAAIARGDRRLGRVLEQVWRDGARLDAWEEYFSFSRWMAAFDKYGLDPAFYASRERRDGETLPWSAISAGVATRHLRAERDAARAGTVTGDCRNSCSGCGAAELIAPQACDADMRGAAPEVPSEAQAPPSPELASGFAKYRLVFEKTGRSRYISHLDLMRTLTRAFARADVPLRHTEGFNPHPRVSLALPLPVGHESVCELMDFETDAEIPPESIPGRLNPFMPEGIVARAIADAGRSASQIKWVDTCIALEYDSPRPGAADALEKFFSQERIIVQKRSKRSVLELDIIPSMQLESVLMPDQRRVDIRALLSANSPSINPELLVAAISRDAPELSPDYVKMARVRLFDSDMRLFV